MSHAIENQLHKRVAKCQISSSATIAHHGTVPNNPNLVPSSVNFSPQQLIVITVNIPPTINAPAFVELVGEFFRVFVLKFLVKRFEKICSSPPFFGKKMKPSRCSIGGFSSLKRIFKTSQTWKLPIGIYVRWKALQHSMHRFCNGFLQNLETHTLCKMCITFFKN